MLHQLPREVVVLICELLLPRDIGCLIAVSTFFHDTLFDNQQLWKALYRLHIGLEDATLERDGEQTKEVNWKEAFQERWILPRWDLIHKHPSIKVSENGFIARTPKTHLTQLCDRSVRVNKPYSTLGSHYIEMSVVRGTYHTLFGICDAVTSECKDHQRPWNPIGEHGVGCCWASDGAYYGTKFAQVEDKNEGIDVIGGPNTQLEKWNTGDRVGMHVRINEIDDGNIMNFYLQFYLNGQALGGLRQFCGSFGASLWVTACFYGPKESLQILPKHHPDTSEEVTAIFPVQHLNLNNSSKARQSLKKVGDSLGKITGKLRTGQSFVKKLFM